VRKDFTQWGCDRCGDRAVQNLHGSRPSGWGYVEVKFSNSPVAGAELHYFADLCPDCFAHIRSLLEVWSPELQPEK